LAFFNFLLVAGLWRESFSRKKAVRGKGKEKRFRQPIVFVPGGRERGGEREGRLGKGKAPTSRFRRIQAGREKKKKSQCPGQDIETREKGKGYPVPLYLRRREKTPEMP